MPLNILNWTLALSPVLVLLGGILLRGWKTSKAGAFSWFVAVFIAWRFFNCDARLLALANSKGMSLALYVLLIIWSAIFLYNVVEGAGAIKVISGAMQRVSEDGLVQCLLLAWCFSSLLQGIAGFGVPVAVVAPIMVEMGFNPAIAVSACLVGHSWSISFGSMGSSYNSIQLVTGIPGEVIGPCMAMVFSVAIFSTGFAVSHIYAGAKGLKKGLPLVLLVGTVMSFALWFMNRIGIAQLATLMAGAGGCLVLGVWALIHREGQSCPKLGRAVETGETEMVFGRAASPYFAVIFLTLFSQLPGLKKALAPYSIGLDYPAVQTGMGYAVAAIAKYSKIQLFSHPAPILFLSALFGCWVYGRKKGALSRGYGKMMADSARATVQKCVPTTVGIVTMVMMALVMSDSGMTNLIARGVAGLFGKIYPIASPFVGALGTFITGSNTNSNIMFGVLQYDTALLLGESGVLLAAAQSVGGSLGVSISPSTIMMGTSNVGIGGRESEIMGKTIRYCLASIALVGVFVWILAKYRVYGQ